MTTAPVPALVERPQVRGPSSVRVRSGPTSGRKRRRARARAPRVPQLGELLRDAQQRLDQDPLSQPASPPAFDFSRLRIHDDAEEADQRRTEVLDPATLGIRMATDVLRSLRGDPEDRSHRVQLQLARIDDPDLSTAVLAKLKVWLPSSEYSRVTGLVAAAKADASPLPLQSHMYPGPVQEPDPQGDQVARDDAAVSDATNRAQLKAEYLPREAQTHAEEATAEAQKSVNAADAEKQKTATQQAAKEAGAGQQQQDALAAALRAQQTQGKTPQQGQQRAQAQQVPVGGAATQQGAAVMPAGAPAAAVPQAGGAPAAPMTMSADGTPPVNLNVVDVLANAPGGPLASHQMRDLPGNTAERQPDRAPPGEEPIGAENTDLAEIDLPEPALPVLPAQQPIPASAYLPASDIDVSQVPAADQLKLPESGSPPPPPAAPSFPEPPAPAMVAPRPGEQDPVEAQLTAQAARESATIDPAPGQVGPDDIENEPDVVPESVAPGPEVMPAEADAGPAGPAGPENITDDAAVGPGVASGSGVSADAAFAGADAAGPGPASADAAGPAADGGPAAAGPGAAPAGADSGGMPADASLEPGGGSCAGGPAPSADAGPAGSGPVGGGGPAGGGGSAAPPPQPPVPDVSQQQPQTALAVVGRLPVVPLARGLSGVNASVGHSVGKERDALAKSPPELERPSGAPQTLHGQPPVAQPADYGADKVQKADAKGPDQQAKPQGKQVAGGPTPADQVPAPKVTGNAKGNATSADVQNAQNAVNNVPTTDPTLDHASVGAAPTVQLTGQADPAQTDTQLTNLRDRAARILVTGRDDAARPLGENEIYPDVPAHEMLKASVPAGGATGPAAGSVAGGAVNSGPAGDQAVSAVAKQERGPQIQAAVSQGQGQMTAGEQAKQKQEAQDRQQHQAKVAAAIKKSADDQTAERGKVAVQVRQQRTAWQDQETKLSSDADTDAGKKHDKARSDVAKKKSDTDSQVDKRQQTDNATIIAKRQDAEAKARSEQAKKQNQSSGWFGWVTSKVSEAFNDLISAVKGIFDAARKFVQGVIDTFKKFVTGLIDAARKAIIGLISTFANVILAIGDQLLSAFPSLRDKFRKLIIGLRDAAIALVNKVANFLKKAITDLLNFLGKALSALLDALEKQLLAAIKSVEAQIQGIINFVKSAIALLGEFAQIVRDVAADPGGWIKKLGSAIVNGIHYYLWDAIKTAVKNWFVGEIQQILGLGQVLQGGMQMLDVLRKGCITIGKIIQMAWQALISALPSMLIQLVIEKVVSFLVPALGGIITIVQSVIAAYNTISSIITAIGKFVAFLKDVRSGTAARPFAQAVAAGAVALIAFVANWLLSKLKGAAKGIGSKLKGIAQKILAFLKRGAKAVRKGIGKAFNLAKRGAKAAARGIKRGIKAAGRLAKRGLSKVKSLAKRGLRAVVNGVKALGRRLAKTKFGKFVKGLYDKLKTKYQAFKSKLADWRNKFKEWRESRKKNKPSPEQRLEAAVERIRPKILRLLNLGVPRIVLRAVLGAMRIWYRLSGLSIIGDAIFKIEALLNPQAEIAPGVTIDRDKLLRFIRKLGEELRTATPAERAAGYSGFSKTIDPATGATVTTRTITGGGAGVVAENIDTEGGPLAKRRRVGDQDLIQFVGAGGTPIIDVKSELEKGGNPRNFAVGIPDPFTGLVPKQTVSYRTLKNWIYRMTPARRQAIADHMVSFLGDTTQMTGVGSDDRFIKSATVLTVLTEGKRNPAAMVTHALVLDMVAQGKMNWKTAFRMMPMAKPVFWKVNPLTNKKYRTSSPVEEADILKSHLFGPRGVSSKRRMRRAEMLANREVNVIQAWVSRMNIAFSSKATAQQREQQLLDEIEKRMMQIYRRAQQASGTAGPVGAGSGGAGED